MKQEAPICGYVNIKEKNYAFILENHTGRIFNNAPYTFVIRSSNIPRIIYGVTDRNYNIALCISNPQVIGNCIVFSCPYFIMDKTNCFNYDICEFDKIEFVGGSLNSIIDSTDIYENNGLYTDIFENGCSIKFKPLKEVTKKFEFPILESDVEFEYSIIPYEKREGNKLGETNSTISIKFSNAQKIEELEKWYILIKKLTSLLVVQHNIDFDSIKIYFDLKGEDKEITRNYAKVFVNHNYENSADKKPIKTLELNLFDSHMQELINVLENNKFSLMFLPKSNSEIYTIDYEKVKNICTALEFEFTNIKNDIGKNKLIDKLKKLVKAEIRKFKSANPELDSYDYSSIEGSISNWTLPAKKQVWELYNKYSSIVQPIYNKKSIDFSYQKVSDFIDFRNKITHRGEYPRLTQEIAETAHALTILIYVSLLKRIELEDEVIKYKLCLVF